MSRLKIKLRLPTEQQEQTSAASAQASHSISSGNSNSIASPAAAAPSTLSPLGQPTARIGAEDPALDEQEVEVEAAADGGEEDVSMAASLAGGESEDELASDDGDDAENTSGTSKAGLKAHAAGSPSNGLTAAQRAKKRTARMVELEKMTAEEIDALPPAKRRKGAKARGASGPGRGWRKGLKMGEKPKYTLPDLTPVAEGTPTSFGDSARASPMSAMSGSPEPQARPSANNVNATSSKRAGPGGLSLTAQAALAGKSILPSGRAPQAVAAAMAFGPPVKPPPKVINVFPATVAPLNRDPSQKSRQWQKGPREWINLAGRVCKVSCWWGGEDRGFDPEKERETEEAAAAAAGASGSNSATTMSTATAGGVDASTPSGPSGKPSANIASSPSASRTSTPKPIDASTGQTTPTTNKSTGRGRGGGPGSRGGRGGRGRGGASSARSASNTAKSSPSFFPGALSAGDSAQATAASPTSEAGTSNSHLPKPKFQPGGGAASSDWKGSSTLSSSATR